MAPRTRLFDAELHRDLSGGLKTDATNIACGSDGIRATARVNFHDERPSGAGTIARGMDDRSPSNRVQPLRRPLLVARGSLKRQVARKGQDAKEGEAGDSEQGHCWD